MIRFILFSVLTGVVIVLMANFTYVVHHSWPLYLGVVFAGFSAFITSIGSYSYNNMILRKKKDDI